MVSSISNQGTSGLTGLEIQVSRLEARYSYCLMPVGILKPVQNAADRGKRHSNNTKLNFSTVLGRWRRNSGDLNQVADPCDDSKHSVIWASQIAGDFVTGNDFLYKFCMYSSQETGSSQLQECECLPSSVLEYGSMCPARTVCNGWPPLSSPRKTGTTVVAQTAGIQVNQAY